METFHTERIVTQILKPRMLNGDFHLNILLYFLNLESRKSIRKVIWFIFQKGANICFYGIESPNYLYIIQVEGCV